MIEVTPENIKKARLKAGQTVAQAAEIVHVSRDAWHRWERGNRKMPLASFELYLFITGQAVIEI